MKKDHLQYLNCISCRGKFNLKSFDLRDNEIIQGILECKKCHKSWPIIKAIPRILPDPLMKSIVYPKHKNFFMKYCSYFPFLNNSISNKDKLKLDTANSFAFEWLSYSKVIKEFKKDWKRYFSPFISPNDVKGKVVADMGCGLAKQGHFTAKYGAKYIGIDLSDAVEAAYKNTKEFDSLVVQADVYHLPLDGSKIDYYYSIGVIHHLPNPQQGFLNIVKLMKKKSKILIWVYGRHKNSRALLIYNPLRKITTKINQKFLYQLCHIPALITHLFNFGSIVFESFGFKNLAKKIPFYYYSKFSYSFKHNDSFDILATPKQEYYSFSEIGNWFKTANLSFQLRPDTVQGIKGFGEKC